MPSKTTCDIIVIGGGSAALEAAISASEAGLPPPCRARSTIAITA